MMKTVKILFYVLVGVIFFSFTGQIQAANITFTADTQIGFTSVPTTLYVNTGSEGNSLIITGTTLIADIPADSTFDMETGTYTALKAAPSNGTLTLTFDTTYFSSGYVTQWTASSTLATTTAVFTVGVSEANSFYAIEVNDVHYSYSQAGSNGLVAFTYSGGFSAKTFKIYKVNLGGSTGGTGGGGVTEDTTAPSISNIETVLVRDTETRITWNTNESSLSWVVYGTSTNFGLEEKTTSYTTSHSITLKNLLPSTTYYYQLKSKDSAGNAGSYENKTFTTLALGQVAEETKAPVTKPVSEMNVAELTAEISRITALIVQLQSQLTGMISGGIKITGIPSGFAFKNTLKSGMVLSEVKYLQLILNSDLQTKLASSGVGSSGNETNIFGALTKAAVIKFQEKYASEILTPLGLIKGTGIVGKATISKINSLLGR